MAEHVAPGQNCPPISHANALSARGHVAQIRCGAGHRFSWPAEFEHGAQTTNSLHPSEAVPQRQHGVRIVPVLSQEIRLVPADQREGRRRPPVRPERLRVLELGPFKTCELGLEFGLKVDFTMEQAGNPIEVTLDPRRPCGSRRGVSIACFKAYRAWRTDFRRYDHIFGSRDSFSNGIGSWVFICAIHARTLSLGLNSLTIGCVTSTVSTAVV